METAQVDKLAALRQRLALLRLKKRLWPYRELFDKSAEWVPRHAIARCKRIDSKRYPYAIFELIEASPTDWQPWVSSGLPAYMSYDLRQAAIKWNSCVAAQYMLFSPLEEEFKGSGVRCELADFDPRLAVGFRWEGDSHLCWHSVLRLVDENGFRFIFDLTLEQLGWASTEDWLMEEDRYVEEYTQGSRPVDKATASKRVTEHVGSDPHHIFTRDVRRLMREFAAMSEEEREREHPLVLRRIEQISETSMRQRSWYDEPN
ncbi:uncharacterized protein EI97DRAFT_69959 [Westerdykella ornata]|uniref:Uncharacterized protein n=1 Tax=Westerdykella ornata TaxID=318751 RepID=A0A6A6JHZ1_WESOR|nr:uncharacterized protein EI97DRAFT_69959 [Westerdykella ornata]KAF2275703.1 hypothetical protein EI97DRAFT_69959 [Westerdykella ornata]